MQYPQRPRAPVCSLCGAPYASYENHNYARCVSLLQKRMYTANRGVAETADNLKRAKKHLKSQIERKARTDAKGVYYAR